jgi:hypothetical protein
MPALTVSAKDNLPVSRLVVCLASLLRGLGTRDYWLMCFHRLDDNPSEQPAAKRRKLEASASASQPTQSSFTDVLERLKEETDEETGMYLVTCLDIQQDCLCLS